MAKFNKEKRGLSDLAYHFADFLRRMEPSVDDDVLLLASLTVHAAGEGHVCLPLAEHVQMFADSEGKHAGADHIGANLFGKLKLGADKLLEKIKASAVVGRPGEIKPLILDEAERLYLFRYWQYESKLAGQLLQRAAAEVEVENPSQLSSAIAALFPEPSSTEVDWQKVAVVISYLKKFSVISGGPGTGKTFTVLRLLALLIMTASSPLKIGLVAPTGKAADRLQKSIKTAKDDLLLSTEILARIPERVSTIHRLLGFLPNSPYFKHDKKNLLDLDVLIVDEASMVDLALICKLLDALPPESRLVLLGDKDQLSSVEAGRVLGEICRKKSNFFSEDMARKLADYGVFGKDQVVLRAQSPLDDSLVILEKSYRFDDLSGIGRLAGAINNSDLREAEACLVNFPQVLRHQEIKSDNDLAQLAAEVVEGYGSYLACVDPVEAFEKFNRFRLLCVHRNGKFGVVNLNQWVEKKLAEAGLLEIDDTWYIGRPVLITANDYNLKLFNGDTGITMQENNKLRVFFINAEGALRSFSPIKIPVHETAFAMTVHKSQGSEFERVSLVMPDEDSQILSRELIYTAVTRAKESFALWGSLSLFGKGICKPTIRNSGLADLLSGNISANN